MSKRRNAIAENWVAYPCSMIESPAMRVLSQAAVRVMHRLEVEHMHHGGAENGRLIVTRDQFVEWGIERNAIAPAIRELAALGFVEITGKGCAGNATQHKATQYRLTYVNSKSREQPTNEWRKIETTDNAERIAAMARAAKDQRARDLGRRGARGRVENKNPVSKTLTGTGQQNPDRNANFPVSKTLTASPVSKTLTTIYISGRHSDSVATRWPAGVQPGLTRRCPACNADIESLRTNARFCSAACRLRAHRARKSRLVRGMQTREEITMSNPQI